MLPQIEEAQSVLHRIFSDEIADLVRWLRLQIALFDIEHLVKGSANVEAEAEPLWAAVDARIAESQMTGKSVGIVSRVKLGRGGEDILRLFPFEQPAAVREGELELVAIFAGLLRTENRFYLR